MKLRNIILTGAAMLMAVPTFASTYYGGLEDYTSNKAMKADNDYNDMVFSLSGNITLQTTDGKWYTNPTVNNDGKPFWDNLSYDGTKKNIGYCIYGGGDCGKAIAPGASYLASSSSPNVAANDVFFSHTGSVTDNILVSITSGSDTLYWFDGTNSGLHQIGNKVGQSYSFNPNGDFGLAAYNSSTGYTYFSVNSDCSDPSHFAFFQASPVPEPSTMGAMGAGLMLVGMLYRRLKAGAQK